MGWRASLGARSFPKQARSCFRMPKVTWCWRCEMDLPMLSDAEFEDLRSEARRVAGAGGGRAYLEAMCDLYTKMTGLRETNAAAIHHHVLSQYGPPCRACSRPLRTPRARMCASCGTTVE